MDARPNLKVIVCSDYAVNGQGQGVLNAGAQGFIQELFLLETLSELVKEALGGQIDWKYPVSFFDHRVNT